MAEKNRLTSGADEKTPSHPQYFSWINNTNEGATEAHTLINLEYFKWLHDTYGMNLEIYAWDAGNLDGSAGTYAHPDETPKLKIQYPNGYGPSAKKAAEFGCALGVWGGADGFGDTPEEEEKRRELIVSLCRDYGFKEFKFDTVCGNLRPEKRLVFKEMIDECRKYVPDLVVLNHRNDLGEAEICATTFLLGGMETYIDVTCANHVTGPHHRMVTLSRDLVPGMQRLTEDHGVCLSSHLDYFEDDLVLQAFARSLILAPETYGNPWLLRDIEQERMAKIYNLHWKYRDILVNGSALPESYGKNAAVRGDGKTRILALNNPSWYPMPVTIFLSDEIGLTEKGEYIVKTLHPYESYVGTFNYGEKVEVTVNTARAALILVQEKSVFNESDFVLTNCYYETITDGNRMPKKIYVFGGNGEEIGCVGNSDLCAFALDKLTTVSGDSRIKNPVFLGEGMDCNLPQNTEQLYEATCFRANCDSLESQSLKRSGDTAFPAVKAARDAFFAQETYKARGNESRLMFDGDDTTYFDAESVYYAGGVRVNGGCLRVDLGMTYDVSRVEIEFFEIDEPRLEVQKPNVSEKAEYTADAFVNWADAPLMSVDVTCENVDAPVVVERVHNIVTEKGVKKTAVYTIGGAMRYFRLDTPMDRIYAFRVYGLDGAEIKVKAPKANNTLSTFTKKNFITAKKITVHIPEDACEGSYIAAGIDGCHGIEGAYCGAMCEGKPVGFTERAVAYPVNNWEHRVAPSDCGYTYYLAIDETIRGKDVEITFLLEKDDELLCRCWLCDTTDKKPIITVE